MRVLFVCVHNACRSQMAEAFFNQFAKGATASSAGSKPDAQMDEKTATVMREIGLDISGKKPAGYSAHMGQEFDYVITMGCKESCPVTPKNKTMAWNIEDPKGKELGDYRRVREEVERQVLGLVRELGVKKHT